MTPEMLAVRRRLFEDFEFYAANALFIRTKEQTIAPFSLNRAQRHLLGVIDRQVAERGYVRMIILKGRQMGSSTFVEGWLYWWVSQREAHKALVVAHDAVTAGKMFDMTKRFHDRCPEILRPHTDASAKKELSFDKLDSKYTIATAGGDGIVRGDTITCAHLSEFGWWPESSHQANFSGLMDAIPSVAGTAAFIESTANGFNIFAAQYDAALNGRTDFEAVFLPWFWDDFYRLPAPKDFSISPEEERLVALYGLDNEQLMFRRKKVAEKGLDLFRQEYPCCAEEAFLTSGHPVFNPDRVVEMTKGVRKPIARKTLVGRTWEDSSHGDLQCFLPFDPEATYYIGADVSGGVRKDFSVAQVFDDKRRQAAIFSSDRMEPDAFGTTLAELGRYYGNAQIIVERNNHGILTNRVLHVDEAYPHVYQETVFDKVTDTETEHVGFQTNMKSKPLIIDKLRANIRDREIEIYDKHTLAELKTFIVTKSGKLEAEKSKHDDCVMALALADHINEGKWEPIVNQDSWFASYD